MHTLRLLLLTTEYDEQVMNKRFYAISHIHNVLVKHAKKLLRKISHDSRYEYCRKTYVSLPKKENLSSADKKYKKQLSQEMKDIRISMGLSEAGLQSYIKKCARRFSKCLSSQQVQKEATRVWNGVEKVLFSDGKDIHFKKNRDFPTIGGKTNTNGVKFNKSELSIEWLGLQIQCKRPKKDAEWDYLTESLDHDISYCEIERKMFPNGWHYYVIVYLKGDAPRKTRTVGDNENVTGIDMGISTVATVSDIRVALRELVPDCIRYNKKIQKLLRRMDASKRKNNPNKYKPDGTIDKTNRDRWTFSRTYFKNRRKLKSLYRQKSAYIKQSHEILCNELLADSVNFITEEMSFKGLQRKAKKTERSDKTATVRQKNGDTRQIYKYKKKKRFGKSLNNRAPAMFLNILERKCSQYDGSLLKVDTKSFRASQYDHVTDTYTKTSLRERDKQIGGNYVQRDLYSAFLIKNSNPDLNAPDREKCLFEFERFLDMQNTLIDTMKQNHISMKSCFGF